MTLRYSPEFIAQAATVNAWWIENRSAARSLFEAELLEALASIRDNPAIGLVYARSGRGETRRLMLRRTRYHAYYRSHDELVLVLAVWSARRGYGPPLP